MSWIKEGKEQTFGLGPEVLGRKTKMPDAIIAVYFVTNKKDGPIYIGSSSFLQQRIDEHKSKSTKGFTKRYNLDKLVYIEPCEPLEQALILERRYKKYNRNWKIRLIEDRNPEWKDLSNTL